MPRPKENVSHVPGKWWLLPVFFLWTVWVFAHFFPALYRDPLSFTSPFDPAPNSTASPDILHRCLDWLAFLPPLSSAALCVGFFWVFGRKALPLFGLEPKGPVRFLLETTLGMALADWLWLGLGLTGLWSGVLGILVLLAGTWLLLRPILALPRARLEFPKLKGWDRPMAALLCVYAVLLVLQDLLPETFYDSLNYFLGIPAYWWSRHGMVDQPFHALSGYPFGGSLIYLNAFLLAGGQGAKVLAGAFLMATALLAWAWTEEKGYPRWTMAVAVLTFPLLYLNAWATRVDSLVTLVLLLFFYCVQKVLEGKRDSAWMALGGLLASLALSIKPTALVPVLGGVAGLLLAGKGARFLGRALGGWGLSFLLGMGPWLLRDLVHTGDPFFPYVQALSGIRALPVAGYLRMVHENQQFLPMDHGLGSWVTLPWRLTMPGAGDGQFLGPIPLAVLPLLVWLALRRGPVRPMAWIFWLTAVAGLGLSHMLRFSLPVLTFGLLLTGVLFSSLKPSPWRAVWPGVVLLNAVLCFPQLLSLSAQWSAGGPFWTGAEDADQYLSRRLGPADMEMTRIVDRNLPRDSRLLLVGDSRALYYDRQVLAQSAFDEPFFATAVRKGKDEEGVLRELRRSGIDYVVVDRGLGSLYSREYHQYDALTPVDQQSLKRFSQRGLEFLAARGSLGLFRVRDRLIPPDPRTPDPFSFLSDPAADRPRSRSGKGRGS
ncbi:MAG TPA: hypothetical protein VHE12_06725 [bacterium]|nr:hypothetical protein [bacterium]